MQRSWWLAIVALVVVGTLAPAAEAQGQFGQYYGPGYGYGGYQPQYGGYGYYGAPPGGYGYYAQPPGYGYGYTPNGSYRVGYGPGGPYRQGPTGTEGYIPRGNEFFTEPYWKTIFPSDEDYYARGRQGAAAGAYNYGYGGGYAQPYTGYGPGPVYGSDDAYYHRRLYNYRSNPYSGDNGAVSSRRRRVRVYEYYD